MKLPLVYYPNPALRRKCPKISLIDEALIAFIADFTETMLEHNAIGFGAPQVSSEYRVCLSRCTGGTIYDQVPELGAVQVFINPVLSNPSKETWKQLEANPCIPGIQEEVERPVSITVTAQGLDGALFTQELSGWPARVLMHENDHLNGVLFIDRLCKKVRSRAIHMLATTSRVTVI